MEGVSADVSWEGGPYGETVDIGGGEEVRDYDSEVSPFLLNEVGMVLTWW